MPSESEVISRKANADINALHDGMDAHAPPGTVAACVAMANARATSSPPTVRSTSSLAACTGSGTYTAVRKTALKPTGATVTVSGFRRPVGPADDSDGDLPYRAALVGKVIADKRTRGPARSGRSSSAKPAAAARQRRASNSRRLSRSVEPDGTEE